MNLTKANVLKMLENDEKVIYKDLPEKLRADMDIYKLVSKTNRICFKYAVGDNILRNEGLIKDAIKGTYYNYDYIPEDLKQNKELNLQLIKINPSIYKRMNVDMQSDEDIFLKAMNSLVGEEIIIYVKNYFTNSKRILISMLENHIRVGVSIFSDKLKGDKELLKQICSLRPQEIVYFKKEIREQKDILRLWLKNNVENIIYFDYKEEYLPLYKAACEKEIKIFSLFPEEVRGNKNFILDLLIEKDMHYRNKLIIGGLAPNLANDRDVFLKLAKVKSSDFDLLLPESLYDDVEILSEYVKNKERVIGKKSFVIALHKHKEVALLLENLDYKLLPKKLQNSVHFNSELFEKDDVYFKFAPDAIRGNKNFIKKYATFNKNNFSCVPLEAKTNVTFMIELLKDNIDLLDIMPKEVRLNREVLDNFRGYISTSKYKFKEEYEELQRMNREEELHYILKKNDDETIKKKKKI